MRISGGIMIKKDKNYTKKLLSVFFVLLVVGNSLIVLADTESPSYNTEDIKAIQRIYNQNSDLLSEWDFSNPLSITETEWKLENNCYFLLSIDLSNFEIIGNVDISQCTSLENYSFSNTNINEAILPNYLNTIPEGAFENCPKLEYINIPDGVNLISNKSFKNCSSLKSVIINNDSTVIGSDAFSGCIALKCIISADNITAIGRNCFNNCYNLTFYTKATPSSTSYIYQYAVSSGFDCKTAAAGSASGYAGIKRNYPKGVNTINLSLQNRPYKSGTAYLYNSSNILISTSELNENGCYTFIDLPIGYKYRLVIDGNTAIARSEYFIMTDETFFITTKENALAIVVCDYNKDGLITYEDAVSILHKAANAGQISEEEKSVYDIDGDGYVNVNDTMEVRALANIKEYYN